MSPAPTTDLVEKYQRQLLELARFVYQKTPITDATQRAFLATPRHLFVKRYREGGSPIWHDLTSDNLQEHIAALYADHPLTLFGEEDQDRTLSTISQPSFVLHMLDMLQLQPGQKVFELGAGSGWNAALMGYLVGPEGHVYSIDILPEIASAAQETIVNFGLQNVTVLSGEGGEGYAPGAPYDRVFFTAGSYDIPRAFYEQIRDQGLLLIGLKSPGCGDNLFLFRKVADHFESIEAMPCGWLQLRGKYQIQELAAVPAESLAEWSDLQDKIVATAPFWWGGMAATDAFGLRTLAIRSFLAITEPLFRTFKIEKSGSHTREEQYFGLWDSVHHSLVLVKDDALISYGNRAALEQLMQRVRQWIDLGMPIAACFKVAAYRGDHPVSAGKNQWLVKRHESQFLWSL
jgi:protein-L-isoaspartate(D-aspartate) O-methyltransferase